MNYPALADTKPDIEKTIAQMDKTYSDACRHAGGNVTFRALPPCDVAFYSEIDLTAFDFALAQERERYADVLCGKLAHMMRARSAIDDNMIASISPMLGIGDYSAFVAGEIDFRPDTSWSSPVLDSAGAFTQLPPLGSAVWYRRFLDICERLLQRFAGSGIPFMRGFFSPLDLAAALRGDGIYYDFYDDPDGLHALLDYCATATIAFATDIYALAGRYLAHTPHGMWMLQGNINMSEDIACMISGELYRTFCAPHTQRVIRHFGRGHLHCHSRAMYLVKELCALENVVHLWLPTDPNQPRPIEHIEQLVQDARGTCLAIDCDSFEEIERQYGAMKQGNFSVCLPTSGVEESVRLAERFARLRQGGGAR